MDALQRISSGPWNLVYVLETMTMASTPYCESFSPLRIPCCEVWSNQAMWSLPALPAWAGVEEITAFLNTNILIAIVFCGFAVFCILTFSQMAALGPIDHPWIGQQHGCTPWIFAGSSCLILDFWLDLFGPTCSFSSAFQDKTFCEGNSNHISKKESLYPVVKIV